MKFKKKIVIIPFLIAVVFTIGMPLLVILYSYGSIGSYTTNQTKFENYAESDYFNEDGEAIDEIVKNIKFNANKYELVSQKSYDGDFNVAIYTATTQSGDDTIETINIYITDVQYKKYEKKDQFVSTKGIVYSDSEIALIRVKGTGDLAIERLNEAISEYEAGSVSSGTLISTYNIEAIDKNAKGISDTTYAFAGELLSSKSGDFTDFSNLNNLYEDFESVGHGYTFALINTKVNDNEHLVRVIDTFELTDLLNVEDFEAKETALNGYKQDWALAGYIYFDYVLPTLIWQGALALVICAILSFLFYAIWGTEDKPTEKELAIGRIKEDHKKK